MRGGPAAGKSAAQLSRERRAGRKSWRSARSREGAARPWKLGGHVGALPWRSDAGSALISAPVRTPLTCRRSCPPPPGHPLPPWSPTRRVSLLFVRLPPTRR